MESKGKYVWDPDKQAWVRPGEAAPPRPKVRPARPAREPREEKPAQYEATTVARPVEAVIEPEPVEELYEEVIEGAGLEPVGAARRAAAVIVDLIAAFLLGSIFPLIFGEATWTSVTLSHVLVLFYFVGMWRWRGQTLGKLLVGAKVVSADGSPVTLVKALIRGIILFVYYIPALYVGGLLIGTFGNYLFPAIAIVVILVQIRISKSKRAPHDLIAGTADVSTASVGLIEEVYEEEEEEQEAGD